MSFSLSKTGSIVEIRRYMATHHIMDSVDGRIAAAAVSSHLDQFEAAGGTHAIVSASGHGGSHNVNARRDSTAEQNYRDEVKGAEFDRYYRQGVELGIIVDRVEDGVIGLNIPHKAKQGRIDRIVHEHEPGGKTIVKDYRDTAGCANQAQAPILPGEDYRPGDGMGVLVNEAVDRAHAAHLKDLKDKAEAERKALLAKRTAVS